MTSRNSKAPTARRAKAGDPSLAKQEQLAASSTELPLPYLTTNQGTRIVDNHNSLRAGVRGPSLLEDFILREKITHFDHERIPERIVHARGSAAHGFFECYEPLTDLTKAAPFREAGDAVITKTEWDDPSVGRFARVHDPEGNPIELWEPPAK